MNRSLDKHALALDTPPAKVVYLNLPHRVIPAQQCQLLSPDWDISEVIRGQRRCLESTTTPQDGPKRG